MENKKELKKIIEEKLNVPKKAVEGDENQGLEKKLGYFLVDCGYIQGIEKREDDWGFVYYSITRKIALSQKDMPHEKWEHCIFKMGFNEETKENLFPIPGEETEMYRFLHEANHAYQEYLCSNECPQDPKLWYEKVLGGEITSCYGDLFAFCFQKRIEEDCKEGERKKRERGLSIWGNASNYSIEDDHNIPNKASEIAVRAQEDADELVTMYLWHPKYFEVYLDYLSLNHNNPQVREKEITKEDLEKEGLAQLSKEEVERLKEIVFLYVNEMKGRLDLYYDD
jgi:hypothetical protein